MGLDVYLYRYDDRADYERRADLSEVEQTALWDSRFGDGKGDIKSLPQDEQDAFWDEYRAIESKHGVKYREEVGRTRVETNSSKYPDHLFEVGYFRSSYNDGGINNVARTLSAPGLYDIIQPPEDEYAFSPDWSACKGRADAALVEWREKVNAAGSVRIEKVAPNPFGQDRVASEAEALALYKKTMGEPHAFKSFESAEGIFCEEPRPVVAIMHGTEDFMGRKQPCVYLAVKDESPYESYVQSIEIVCETIDFVLTQPDPEKYVLHWSG